MRRSVRRAIDPDCFGLVLECNPTKIQPRVEDIH